MIKVMNVSKTYHLGESRVEALRHLSLEVQRGEFVALAGASGSGKSTLLNIIGTIEKPNEGTAFVEDQDIGCLSPNAAADLRAHKIGFVFQTFNLLPVLTAYENVEYPLRLQKTGRSERDRRVRSILDEVGLGKFAGHRPAQLSGGQRQRVAIARALVGAPAVILADEPTANLDHHTGLDIIDLMKRLKQKSNATLLFATHDPKIIERADRVIRLQDGQLTS